MTRAQIESRYGVRIEDDSYYSPLQGKFCKAYRIYSADGCAWENGLRTIKAVEKECREYAEALVSIKNRVNVTEKKEDENMNKAYETLMKEARTLEGMINDGRADDNALRFGLFENILEATHACGAITDAQHDYLALTAFYDYPTMYCEADDPELMALKKKAEAKIPQQKETKMGIDQIKKEFSKTIGEIRKDAGAKFPKAMMTGQQMAKRTATVNCGGEWYSAERSKEIAAAVMGDARFAEFLNKCNAKAAIEANPFGGVQIRIHY